MMPQLAIFKCYHIAMRVRVPDEPFRSLAFTAGGIQLVIIPVDYSGNERVLIDQLADGLVNSDRRNPLLSTGEQRCWCGKRSTGRRLRRYR